MNAKAILNWLSKLGVTASAQCGNIAIRPASEVPPELKAEVRFNKSELLAILVQSLGDGHAPPLDRPPKGETELRCLRKGHSWLLDQHQRWQSGDTTAVDDAEFSRVWNG